MWFVANCISKCLALFQKRVCVCKKLRTKVDAFYYVCALCGKIVYNVINTRLLPKLQRVGLAYTACHTGSDRSITGTQRGSAYITAWPRLPSIAECSTLLGELLVDLTDLEGAEGLHEAGAVVRAGRVLVLHDLLGQLAVELGARVAHLEEGLGVGVG